MGAMSTAGFFFDLGFLKQGHSWVRMDTVERFHFNERPELPFMGTDVRMVTWDEDLQVWHATFGQTFKNRIRWRSPGFDDPVAAYVYAELNQWGL